jgi:hypothetical protein
MSQTTVNAEALTRDARKLEPFFLHFVASLALKTHMSALHNSPIELFFGAC